MVSDLRSKRPDPARRWFQSALISHGNFWCTLPDISRVPRFTGRRVAVHEDINLGGWTAVGKMLSPVTRYSVPRLVKPRRREGQETQLHTTQPREARLIIDLHRLKLPRRCVHTRKLTFSYRVLLPQLSEVTSRATILLRTDGPTGGSFSRYSGASTCARTKQPNLESPTTLAGS